MMHTNHRSPVTTPLLALVLTLLMVVGCDCDDDDGNAGNNGPLEDTGSDSGADVAADLGEDAPMDGGGDTADVGDDADPPATGAYVDAKESPIDERLSLSGLNYPVHVTRDTWGVPHILSESAEDAAFVQGFLHARDRFPQMELLRRSITGRLAEIAGALDAGLADDDIEMRVLGFKRLGEESYAALDADGLAKRMVDAYSAGVNVWLNRLRAGEETLRAEAGLVVNAASVEDWRPEETMAFVKFQSSELSFDADGEVRMTMSRAVVEDTFRADNPDPALAARVGIIDDIGRWAPADPAYQHPGFDGTDGKPRSRRDRHRSSRPWEAPNPEALSAALDLFVDRPGRWLPRRGGLSNSWAVSGERTASGHALLANDPHLGLDSPTIFHEAHLVVEPRTDDDGPAVNSAGVMFPAGPGIIIGFNEHVAWAPTTASLDYTDAYVEELVWTDGEEFPQVMWNGEPRDLEIVTDTVNVGSFGRITDTIEFRYALVPHRGRGPLAPVVQDGELSLPEGDQAISYAWRGYQPDDTFDAIIGWMTATNVQEMREASASFQLGSQNWLFADTSGNIFSTQPGFVPVRPDEAMDYHPVDNPTGWAPWWALSGTGEHDWLEEPLPPDQIPFSLNPERGYIVTANNDQAGVTDDNDPLNDYQYLGYDYDIGFRAGRIERLLNGDAGVFPADHDFTMDDFARMQTDNYSEYGARLSPFFVAAATRALEEYDTPGTHTDLSDVVTANPGARDRIEALRDLLAGWDFVAENGMWNSPTAEQIASSRATTLFNVWGVNVLQMALNDEIAAAPGIRLTSQQRAKGIIRMLESPEETATFDATTGGSILWDDLTTEGVTETQDHIIIAALLQADTWLTERFETDDTDQWLWGMLHHQTFDSIVPSLSGDSPYTLPSEEDGLDGRGFPRSSDIWNVDACNGSATGYGFTCGSGATIRFVVELDPDGVRARNVLPGGQVFDPDSPHFRDQLELWLDGEQHPVRFSPGDVAADVVSHSLFTP